MPGVMEMNTRLFEEQDAILVIAPRCVGELPRKRDVPAETCRAPTQAHGHPETNVLDENVECRGVDLDVEANLFLLPEFRELLSQIRRRLPFVECAQRPTLGRL